MDNEKIEKLYLMLNGVIYGEKLPQEAEIFAKENGFVIIYRLF